jgi:hypothetical protein
MSYADRIGPETMWCAYHSAAEMNEAVTYKKGYRNSYTKTREAKPVTTSDMWVWASGLGTGYTGSAEALPAGVVMDAWRDMVVVKFYDEQRDLEKYRTWGSDGKHWALPNTGNKYAGACVLSMCNPGNIEIITELTRVYRDNNGTLPSDRAWRRYLDDPNSERVETATTARLVEIARQHNAPGHRHAAEELRARSVERPTGLLMDNSSGREARWKQAGAPAAGFCLHNHGNAEYMRALLHALVCGPSCTTARPQYNPDPVFTWEDVGLGAAVVTATDLKLAAAALVAWNLAKLDDATSILRATNMGAYWVAADLRMRGIEIFPQKARVAPGGTSYHIGHVSGGYVQQGDHNQQKGRL